MLSPDTAQTAAQDLSGLESVTLVAMAVGLALCMLSFFFVRRLHNRLPPNSPGILRGGLVFFAAAFLATLVIGALVSSLHDAPADAENMGADLAANLMKMVIIQAGVYLVTLALIVRSAGRDALRAAGFTLKNAGLIAGFSLAAYFCFYPIYLAACFINSMFFAYEPQTIVKSILENPEFMTSPFVLLSAGLLIPMLEEILFRGLLLSGLREYMPSVPAIVLSAAFFSCMHEWRAALPVFALGIILGFVKERTGSLVSSIVVHALHNSLMLFFLPFV